MDTERLTVTFRDCGCPGSPHPEGDTVTMRPALGFAAGAEALRKIIEADGDVNRIAELVGPVYIREGVIGWNMEDERGPVPLDTDLLLNDYTLAYPIAERGDDLYSQAVLAPLLTRMSVPSANGQNGTSIRQTRRSSARARSPRKSSSPNGTAGLRSVTGP